VQARAGSRSSGRTLRVDFGAGIIVSPNMTAIRKILFVDDDDNIRLLIRIALESLTDWQVISADRGTKALDMAREENPDVIVLDMMMPGLDGRQTFDEFKRCDFSRDIPVILMTAKVQRDEVEAYLKLGVSGIITKPFDPMTLHLQISEIMNNCRKQRS
jgi:CheY-like chemotaxis protein